MNASSKSGLSLVEMLLVVVLIGTVSGIGYPIISNIMEEGKKQSAKSTVQCLNAAKQSFKMKNFRAKQLYANQPTNEARYNLIKSYLPNSNTSLQNLFPKGYQVEMNEDLDSEVKLQGPKGVIQY